MWSVTIFYKAEVSRTGGTQRANGSSISIRVKGIAHLIVRLSPEFCDRLIADPIWWINLLIPF
jgi:hypothetical protein